MKLIRGRSTVLTREVGQPESFLGTSQPMFTKRKKQWDCLFLRQQSWVICLQCLQWSRPLRHPSVVEWFVTRRGWGNGPMFPRRGGDGDTRGSHARHRLQNALQLLAFWKKGKVFSLTSNTCVVAFDEHEKMRSRTAFNLRGAVRIPATESHQRQLMESNPTHFFQSCHDAYFLSLCSAKADSKTDVVPLALLADFLTSHSWSVIWNLNPTHASLSEKMQTET